MGNIITPTYDHIRPDLKDWPIYKNSKFREEFIQDLNGFSKQNLVHNNKGSIEEIIEKTIYLEKLRVKNNPWDVDPADDKQYWNGISKDLAEAKASEDPERDLNLLLDRIIHRYNEEIVGGFRIKTFKFARKFLTALLKRIYNSFGENYSKGLWGNRSTLLDKIRVVGHTEQMRKLFEKGTVVLVPTHSSNLDSLVIGYTIDSKVSVPAFVYGAGLNLYNYEIPGYFMNRLGTYKVDRRKKNPIYLECLKSMVTFSLKAGVNNLFFPGGTRSRDGKIETNLKLGLLGSVVEAQRSAFLEETKKNVYIFPVVMSYHFCLEAQGLIDQHLKKMAREKYTKPSRQVKQSGYIWKFIKSIFRHRSNYVFSIGEPIDVFGNEVDFEGNSLDKDGEIVDIRGYFELDGSINIARQRESVYTKLLGEKIADSYLRNNVVLSSQLIAYVAFQILLMKNKSLELYDVLNLSAQDFDISYEDFRDKVGQMLAFLKDMEVAGKIKLSDECHWSLDEMIDDGLYHLGAYHPEKVLYVNPEQRVGSENFRLLYYYHNRLDSYKFEPETIFYMNETNTIAG